MKYSEARAVSEIMKRSREIRQKKQKSLVNNLSLAVLFTFLTGVGAGVYFSGSEGYEGARTVYGSFLLPGSAGGYVLAAVVSFTAGVAITLYLLWRRRKNSDEAPGEDDHEKD